MSQADEGPDQQRVRSYGESIRRRGGSPDRTILIGGGVLLALLVAAGLWYWLGSDGESDPPARTAAAGDTVASPDSSLEPFPDLPNADASDAFVREVVERLSSHPEWAAWLATDTLVHRFVGAVVSVGAGRSPRSELGFMAPEGDFGVRRPEGRVLIDSASYARYDLPVTVFTSLDTEGTARLYRRLHPLFEEVHRGMGFTETPFDAAMARAMETLLAVPVPDGPVELVPSGAEAYEFRDPELESLSPAQKHLLRTGPENVRRVQRKLRELAEAMGIRLLSGEGS